MLKYLHRNKKKSEIACDRQLFRRVYPIYIQVQKDKKNGGL